MSSNVDHPDHYGGDTPYETIKVIDAWDLDFCLGNAVKYISRAGKKDASKKNEDLKKAIWYIQHEIGEDKPIGDVPVKLQKYRSAYVEIKRLIDDYRHGDSSIHEDGVLTAIESVIKDM